MAFNYSPKIVTDGLVLYLDAANSKSYVSGSTTWNDISRSGINGTLVNGPTFNSANGGSIVFDGTNDYGTLSNDLVLSGAFTVCIWQNLTSGSNSDSLNRRTIFSRSNGVTRIQFGNNVQSIALFDDSLSGGTLSTYKSPGATNAIITGTNFNYVVRRDSSNLVQQFINGIILENIFTNQGVVTGTFTLDRLGALGSTSRLYYGNMYNVMVYNRALSDSEILQNYNATKSRFGIV